MDHDTMDRPNKWTVPTPCPENAWVTEEEIEWAETHGGPIPVDLPSDREARN